MTDHMNIYCRYFDHEVFAHNLDELFAFLSQLDEIVVTKAMLDELTEYYESPNLYPRRYKVRPRIYFILIKTHAESLEEFRANREKEKVAANEAMEKMAQEGKAPVKDNRDPEERALDELHELIREERPRRITLETRMEGWYHGEIVFKRMTTDVYTGKCTPIDTPFSAYVYANSPRDCYNRIIYYLQGRSDLDKRCQYPSARGHNFTYDYIGRELPPDCLFELVDNMDL